ncbi:cytotoxic T-lymphocyte protein 4-like isoform X2 [Heterodontus francisci]|uniref:cytotoxic T-lymphocyte protein 4-like isoform X2 n=1 Tax=Heterodontus francisci TaxID=7792 RepID=UPI00355C4F90
MERMRNLGLFILCLPAIVELGGPNMSISQPRFVKTNHSGEVNLVCGFSATKTDEEFQVVLYKGNQSKSTEVCTASFTNGTKEPSRRKDLFHCHVWLSQNIVLITIWGLNVTDTDRYICQVLKTHPPPYDVSSGQWTIIYINRATSCAADHEANDGFLLTVILIILAALLLLYSLSVTGVYCRHKMKEDTIYINVRK